jgi:hypothetical protein
MIAIGKRRPLLLQGAPPSIVRIQTANNTHANTTSTSLAVTWGKPTATGNYLIALFGFSGPPGAFTTLPTGFVQLGATFGNCAVLHAVNAASQTGAQTFNWTNAVKNGCIMMEYQGVLATSPQDGANVTNSGTSAAPATGTLTTTNAVDLLVGLVFQNNNVDATTPTFSAPTNKFRLVTQQSFGIDPAVIFGQGALENVVTATSSYSSAVTSNDPNAWVTILVALKGYGAAAPPSGSLFRNAAELSGLGAAGGPFFGNPINKWEKPPRSWHHELGAMP